MEKITKSCIQVSAGVLIYYLLFAPSNAPIIGILVGAWTVWLVYQMNNSYKSNQ